MSHTLYRQYATPLRLEPRVSRRLGWLLALAHGGALLMLPSMDLSLMVSIPGALVLLLAWLHSRRSQVLRAAPASIRRLAWHAGNRWQLELRSGETVNATLLPRVFIQPWLVILHFRQAGGRKSRLVLLPDMLDRDEFRRLRVRLLIEMKQIDCPAGP